VSNLVVLPVVDLNTAASLLKAAVPDWEWLLRQIESKDGFFRFPKEVTQLIDHLNVGNYPLLYQSEDAIGTAFMRALMSDAEIVVVCKELVAMSPEERGVVFQDVVGGFIESVNEVETLWNTRTPEQAKADFEVMSKEEQFEAIRSLQLMCMACLSSFYQVLSVMVHRQKLTSLVAHAKAGDDMAFVKAVQIDPRVLTTDPYFKQRFDNIHAEGNEVFRRKLSYRMRCAPYRGKVRHKSLWMGFAFLDMCGHLRTLRHREMLDLFDEAGIGGYDNRIEDVKYLSKRLGEYWEFQQNLTYLSTP